MWWLKTSFLKSKRMAPMIKIVTQSPMTWFIVLCIFFACSDINEWLFIFVILSSPSLISFWKHFLFCFSLFCVGFECLCWNLFWDGWAFLGKDERFLFVNKTAGVSWLYLEVLVLTENAGKKGTVVLWLLS